jgi:raffinose/stachyose/melibiose transport system substrate-binding protein
MKKVSVGLLVVAICCTVLIGCKKENAGSNAGSKAESVKLTVGINFPPTDETYKVLESIAADYTAANPGITFEIVNYPDYENTMKTKMAANDLPDLWSTHGWSVARYSEYLEPLNNQSWASKLNPAIKSVVTNSRGEFFVLPFDVDAAGVVFNHDVLNAAGVDPYSIKTWDDFKAACAKIKAIGKIPVDIGGNTGDDWTVGNFFDWTAPSFFITDDKSNSRDALKNGSFDWNNWSKVAGLLMDFRDLGYLNPDYTQGTWVNTGRRLGTGEIAFGFHTNVLITEAKKFGPDAHYGFMPVPSASADDAPTLISGERITLGAWKSGQHKAEALKFLDFCAAPANVSKMAKVAANQPGLVGDGYIAETGDLKEYFDHLTGVRGFPYFDREYLPSGMWDSMCKTGLGLLANTMTMDQAVAKLRDDYTTLREQQ